MFLSLSSIVSTSKTRLDYIDSLRGVAVILVFFTHATELLYPDAPSNFGTFLLHLGYDLNLGRVGVILFFAISGFVIPFTLQKSHDHGLHEFFISRIMRLYPAFIVSVIAAAATRFWMAGEHFSFRSVLLNFTMVPRFFHVEMADGAYWTLEIELIFYLICAFFFVGRSDKSPFVYALLSLAGLIGFLSTQPSMFNNLLNTKLNGDVFYALSFLSVMGWAAVVRKWWDGQSVDLISKCVVVLIPFYWCADRSFLLAKAYATGNFVGVDPRMVLGYALALAIFVLGVTVTKLHWRPFVSLGRISYSFYLFHGSTLRLCIAAKTFVPAFPGRNHLFFLLSFILAVYIATAMFVHVEEPAIEFGRRFAKRLRPHLGRHPTKTPVPEWIEQKAPQAESAQLETISR
jgi:peptidoglycan/LPS O-acetylase OafA/YrhL